MVKADQEKEENAKANKGNIPFGAKTEKLGDGRLSRANFQTEQEWYERLEIVARAEIEAEWSKGLMPDKIARLK